MRRPRPRRTSAYVAAPRATARSGASLRRRRTGFGRQLESTSVRRSASSGGGDGAAVWSDARRRRPPAVGALGAAGGGSGPVRARVGGEGGGQPARPLV